MPYERLRCSRFANSPATSLFPARLVFQSTSCNKQISAGNRSSSDPTVLSCSPRSIFHVRIRALPAGTLVRGPDRISRGLLKSGPNSDIRPDFVSAKSRDMQAEKMKASDEHRRAEPTMVLIFFHLWQRA